MQKLYKPVYGATDVDLTVQYFTSFLQLVIKTHAPYIEKCVNGSLSPGIDFDTKISMNRRNQTLGKTRKSKFNDNSKS